MHEHDRAPDVARTRGTNGTSPAQATGGSAARHLLHLQRTAGNRSVAQALAVQRETPAPAAPGAGNTLGDGSGPVTVTGPSINLDAPMVNSTGVLRASTIVADSVVATSYTPGAGNLM